MLIAPLEGNTVIAGAVAASVLGCCDWGTIVVSLSNVDEESSGLAQRSTCGTAESVEYAASNADEACLSLSRVEEGANGENWVIAELMGTFDVERTLDGSLEGGKGVMQIDSDILVSWNMPRGL